MCFNWMFDLKHIVKSLVEKPLLCQGNFLYAFQESGKNANEDRLHHLTETGPVFLSTDV